MAELFAMVEAPRVTALAWVLGRLPRTPFLEFGRGRRVDARELSFSLSSLLSSSEPESEESESEESESDESESEESDSELDSERLLPRRLLPRLPFRRGVCLVLLVVRGSSLRWVLR